MARQPDASALLAAAAATLTACEQAGITVKLKHGAVCTRFGYVLEVADGRWEARTLAYSPFGTLSEADDEMDE
jgi:hypothetical protein